MNKLKIIGLTLLSMLFISGAFGAEISIPDLRIGLQANINGGNPAIFVFDMDTFEIDTGFSNIGNGKGTDATNTFHIQGIFYLYKEKDLMYGPSIVYKSTGTNSDNTRSMLKFGGAAKKMIWHNFALKLDLTFYNLVGGKSVGVDIEDSNQLLPGADISLIFYIL